LTQVETIVPTNTAISIYSDTDYQLRTPEPYPDIDRDWDFSYSDNNDIVDVQREKRNKRDR